MPLNDFRDPVRKELPGCLPYQSAAAPYQSPGATERTYAELLVPAARCVPHGGSVVFGRRIR